MIDRSKDREGANGEKHTERKYADSPGLSVLSPRMCLAYGGPQARVSSPRVGCSILITSALKGSQTSVSLLFCAVFDLLGGNSILGLTCLPEVSKDLCAVWLDSM